MSSKKDLSKSNTKQTKTTEQVEQAKPPAQLLGSGGEIHQTAGDGPLTTNHGVPISDNQNSLRAHPTGPTLLEDFALREKIFHFDHERIPERIVHARGTGAHGSFECTKAIPELTRASLFQKEGNRVPVFTRFSTVAGGSGSADTPRDVRGFAEKFYTQEGNWDLVGNNIPVFFIQDAIKFPDLIHAVKMESDRGFPQAASAHDTFWDFVSLMPESTHMVMWAMSDRTIPRSLRMIEGFGVHTFRFVDASGGSRFVKFHWRPLLGLQSTVWDEAVKLAGADPDFHRRDLWEEIEAKNFPEWELGVQVFDQAFADTLPYDVLDATKLIPEELLPVSIIGRMVLDRNPDNFFAETEQVAFLPTNVVPGIDFSNDPLLQGRLFSYIDTQKSRLGTTNFHQLPINAPKCPFGNFQRDGHMQFQVPKGRANYEPNSLAVAGELGGPRETPSGFSTAADLETQAFNKQRVRSDSFSDHILKLECSSGAKRSQRNRTSFLRSCSSFRKSPFGTSELRYSPIWSTLTVNWWNGWQRVSAQKFLRRHKRWPSPCDLEPSPALSIIKKSKESLRAGKSESSSMTAPRPRRFDALREWWPMLVRHRC
jgi:catalase